MTSSFRNNNMVFLYAFFPHAATILFQERNREMALSIGPFLYFYFAFNRQAVHIKNES